MAWIRRLVPLILALGILTVSPGAQDPPWRDEAFDIGKYDFTARTIDGQEVRLASFRGQVVFLNFWATWCGPCRLETPGLVNLYEKLKGAQDVVFLAVAVWDDEAAVRRFREEYKVSYPVIFDSDDEIATLYRADAIPQSYLIGRDGKLFQWYEGLVFEADLEKKIHQLLAPAVSSNQKPSF